jgi:hypothetical protein
MCYTQYVEIFIDTREKWSLYGEIIRMDNERTVPCSTENCIWQLPIKIHLQE